MDSKDLLKQYDNIRTFKPPDDPLQELIALKEHIELVIQNTLQWYLQTPNWSTMRMAYEVRLMREVLLEFQMLLEGIKLVEDGSPQEVDLRES